MVGVWGFGGGGGGGACRNRTKWQRSEMLRMMRVANVAKIHKTNRIHQGNIDNSNCTNTKTGLTGQKNLRKLISFASTSTPDAAGSLKKGLQGRSRCHEVHQSHTEQDRKSLRKVHRSPGSHSKGKGSC